MTTARPSPIMIRPAVTGEIPELEALIERSARGLSIGVYDAGEIDALVANIFGIDSELVRDGTYFVATIDGVTAACGGWSRRSTLFGGDRFAGRTSGLLDPARDRARIRAFFVAPEQARRGIAMALLHRCEADAAAAGFTAIELMATLPGVPFYTRAGFHPSAPVAVQSGGRHVQFLPMWKNLATF